MSLDTALAAGDHHARRVPRAVREQQVLDVAEALFIERGFAAASMDELARRVGVSKPVIYDLVGSKEQLFRSTIERSAQELTRRIAEAVLGVTEPRQRLESGAVAFFTFVAEHRRAWAMLLSTAAAGEAALEIAETRRRQADLVRALLLDSAQGATMEPVQADALAHAVNGAFEAAATWWEGHDEVTVEQLTGWTVGLLLPGLEAGTAG